MGDQEHTKQPVQEERPLDVDSIPEEEELSIADASDRMDAEPDDQLSRPDQPDFDEAERRQYEDPPVDRPLSESHRPEDR
ncbi:hypothetical protein ASC77_25160 [Nocardioides sp. Root1257]|uniref:hypothetical protein n=1 Tax=unclassified Nocardioides TaxID=2615069 RepID=UPI0006FB30C1|nr:MULTISPECIES: hypothetical protein [unclassified Nocardioides]KQW50950.1 hypothetical protein ASC77_25160 [Nocardioides sp. Root1257]KRC53746.1 hypothetical protein ASE24_24950 [Nocardioides sp. Root224]